MPEQLIKKYLLLPLFMVCLYSGSVAQIRIASPYSRFGIGDLSGNNNAWNFSLGQTGIALRSPNHINFTNPASYGAFDSLSFVFEGGFSAESVKLTSRLQSTSRSYASLGYLSFGVPVTKWWKTAIGLVPFSDVGYNVVSPEESKSAGSILRLYSGSGGVSQFFWGNAFNITKDFSIGFNVSYLFGNMTRESVVFFTDSIHSMNYKTDSYINVGDFYYSFGAQYRIRLKREMSIVLGGVFAPSTNITAHASGIANTFLLSTSGVEYTKDTIAIVDSYKGAILLPWMAGGGITFQKTDKFLVTADYRYQNWKSFRAFGLNDSLANSYKISVGGEIVPNADNYASYFARVRYRLGFYYDRTYLLLRGRQLNEYGISIGFGLPLRGMKTMMNIGGQFGSRGTVQGDLIKETYFKFVLGFSIYERWFHKRKYF
ncbi:MAG: hypothetical protein NTU51_00975 [Bacteroidetes bacterium]|nr:hypothetical protein [Bacteroidota bacterium]